MRCRLPSDRAGQKRSADNKKNDEGRPDARRRYCPTPSTDADPSATFWRIRNEQRQRSRTGSLVVYDAMCVVRIGFTQPEDRARASRSYSRARADKALAAARHAATEEQRVRLLRTASLYELNAELERRMKSRKLALPEDRARASSSIDSRSR